MKHFLLAGSHPELTLAEAEAVLESKLEHKIGPLLFVQTDAWDGAVLQERLAGTVKLGDIVFELRMTPARRSLSVGGNDELRFEKNEESVIRNSKFEIRELATRIADEIDARPRGDRVLFGLTVFGSSKEKQALKKLPIELKRALQDRNRSVRWVTGDKGEISPAAVAKLKLTTEGYDFVIGVEKDRLVVGLTTHVQNADAWSLRDYGRPFRDTKTGMLPPKLARMMINLATGDGLSVMGVGHNPKPNTYRLLDPFCGGGTVLMEAAMMFPNAKLVGSDIDIHPVAGSKRNLAWLAEKNLLSKERVAEITLFDSPAQHIDKHFHESFDAIVTEGYLGQALHGKEPRAELLRNKIIVEEIWEKSLPVLSRLMKPGAKLVCVWPEYRSAQGHIKTDARSAAESAGLEVVRDDLRYARPDQHLIRRIVVLMNPVARNP